jgi:hypothetical protein
MYWLVTSLMLAAEPIKETEKVFVAPPTIHDPLLNGYQSYINSVLVSSANVNSHWVVRSNRAEELRVYDKHTIEYALDTTCDYNRPLRCGSENYHWVMVTDIFTTENFATIVVKLYDENTQLIASASKSSYSIEKCKEQVKETQINQVGRPATQITEKFPDKCTTLKPSILDKDIKQAVTILFASIHPAK